MCNTRNQVFIGFYVVCDLKSLVPTIDAKNDVPPQINHLIVPWYTLRRYKIRF